jgi:hypothetical protein
MMFMKQKPRSASMSTPILQQNILQQNILQQVVGDGCQTSVITIGLL